MGDIKVKFWIKLILIITVVTLCGGLLYAAYIKFFPDTTDESATVIFNLRADNELLRKRLANANQRIEDIQITVSDLGESNSRLEKELAGSQELAEFLREENKRLGKALDASSSGIEDISGTSGLLRESINRAIEITERYSN